MNSHNYLIFLLGLSPWPQGKNAGSVSPGGFAKESLPQATLKSENYILNPLS
jgi:hypothetical protein